MNDLIWLPEVFIGREDTDRVFNHDSICKTRALSKSLDKLNGIFLILPSRRESRMRMIPRITIGDALGFRIIHPSGPTYGEISARWMGDHQIPLLAFHLKFLSILELASTLLKNLKNIALEVPIRATTRAFLKVTTESVVSPGTDRPGHRLALLTSDEDIPRPLTHAASFLPAMTATDPVLLSMMA